MAGIAHRPPLLMLSKASRNGLGHLVLPLGFHTTSMMTGMPTIVSASCTLVSARITTPVCLGWHFSGRRQRRENTGRHENKIRY